MTARRRTDKSKTCCKCSKILMLVLCSIWADRHIQCFDETATCLIVSLKTLNRPQTTQVPWTLHSSASSTALPNLSVLPACHGHESPLEKTLHMYRAGSLASQIAAKKKGGLCTMTSTSSRLLLGPCRRGTPSHSITEQR